MMVTLQGVIITRVSDFRRFFEWNEFWAKKKYFISLFGEETDRQIRQKRIERKEDYYYYFVNNDADFYLLHKFYHWLINPKKEQQGVRLEPTEMKIESEEGNTLVYALGRLQEYIINVKKQNVITNNTIIGYTLLYLLLKAEEPNSDIKIKYEPFDENSFFNILYEDMQFSMGEIKYPLKLKVFSNSDRKHITINGNQLEPMDCVAGIFNEDNLLYKLLPNKCNQAGLTFKLVKHPEKASTRLVIYGNPSNEFKFPQNTQEYINKNNEIEYRYIDDVVSFITNDYGLATIDVNGDFNITESWYRIKTLRKDYIGKRVLAIVNDGSVITENVSY